MNWSSTLQKRRPDALTVAVWTTILFIEAMMLVIYIRAMNAHLLPLHIYPFIWINLSMWVLWNTPLPDASTRTKRIGAAVAGLYFLILAYFGGLLREGHGFHAHGEIPTEELVTGASLLFHLPPGYGPAFTYSGEYVISAVSPYLLFGFLTLTYLMYVTVVDASGEASIGLVGVFSCVGCSFPLIAALVSGGATTTAVGAFVYSQAYALSTVVFVLTVLFLYWRPFRAENVRSVLLTLGLLFVLVSGTVHLGLGLSGLTGAATVGGSDGALSVLFVAAAVLSYLVVGGYVTGWFPLLPTLSFGTVLMAVVFVLYFDWHLVGTLESVIPVEGVGHDHEHGHSPFAQVGALLRGDPLALISKSAEFLAVLFLGLVAVQEWVETGRCPRPE